MAKITIPKSRDRDTSAANMVSLVKSLFSFYLDGRPRPLEGVCVLFS
jgi:hypothetical protein